MTILNNCGRTSQTYWIISKTPNKINILSQKNGIQVTV